jgi:hypothetical protein
MLPQAWLSYCLFDGAHVALLGFDTTKRKHQGNHFVQGGGAAAVVSSDTLPESPNGVDAAA